MNGIVCAFEGRVGQDPELKYTQNGQALLSFGVAVSDAKAAEGAETEWARVTVWGERAEQLHHAGTLSKGAEVYVEGRLRLNTWQGQDGQQRAGLNVSAWTVQPMGQIGRRPKRPAPLFDVGQPKTRAGGPVTA